jgi:hypothetical protein
MTAAQIIPTSTVDKYQKVYSGLIDENNNLHGVNNPIPTSPNNALTVTNSIDQTAFDLNAAVFSETTNISNDYIFDSLELNFSTAEAKTITVTSADGTILWGGSIDTSSQNLGYNTTAKHFNLIFNQAMDGGDNITVAVTQFSSAGTMDCILKVKQGGDGLVGNPVLGAGSNEIGSVETIAREKSDYKIEIGKGNLTGYSWEFITGDNDDVGTTDTVLRQGGGTGDYPFPTSASQWFIQSDDVNDTLLGSGARTIAIIGLEEEEDRDIANEVVKIVNMDGTTSVQLDTSLYRVNGIIVLTAGSSFSNEGTITLTTLTGGAGDLLGQISINEGNMRQPIRTVPNGETWFSMNFRSTCGNNDDIIVKTVAFTPAPNRVRIVFARLFQYESQFTLINDTRVPFEEGSDLMVLASKSLGAGSGRISCILEFESVTNVNF